MQNLFLLDDKLNDARPTLATSTKLRIFSYKLRRMDQVFKFTALFTFVAFVCMYSLNVVAIEVMLKFKLAYFMVIYGFPSGVVLFGFFISMITLHIMSDPEDIPVDSLYKIICSVVLTETLLCTHMLWNSLDRFVGSQYHPNLLPLTIICCATFLFLFCFSIIMIRKVWKHVNG